MNKYNINHPLRGIGYEKAPVYKQSFKDQIIGVVGGTNSYLSYQKDKRQTLDTTQYDEAYLNDQHDRFMKDRIVMKYRLYGLDGIKKHEKKMLIEWRVIKPLEHMSLKKVKKRVTKWRRDGKGGRENYSASMSGSGDSCYSLHRV